MSYWMTALWLPAFWGRKASTMPAKIWPSTVSAARAGSRTGDSGSHRTPGSEVFQDLARHGVSQRGVALHEGIPGDQPPVRADERPSERRVARQRDVAGRPERAGLPLVAEVVERDRFARVPLRARYPGRHAVEGRGAGAENHAAIENRLDPPHATGDPGVPELEPPPVRLLPLLVEEEKEIHLAAPGPALGVGEEVGVHVQEAARQRLLQPAPVEFRVG